MWDFSKLLGSLAGEDSKGFLGGVIDPNARKRTPPKTELTPSENAIQDIASAVRDAQPVNSRNGDFGANSASSLDSVRQATGNDQPITTDASVSSNVTNRPMDYVPVSPSDVQQGRVGTQPVVVQPQYSTPPTAQQEMPIAQASAPASNPSAMQSSGNPLEDLRQQKIDLNAQPIQKQSFWKDFGTNLILGANAFFNPQNGPSPMVGWGAVKRQNENNALDRQIKPLEAIKAQQDKEAYDKARIDNVYADNKLNEQKAEDAKLYRQSLLDDKAAGRKASALNKINTSRIFDPTNAAHRALAQEAGLDPDTMTKWDFSAPHVAKIGDEKYLYDRTTGAFKPSGLPPDPSETRQEFEVQVPGEQNPRKFLLTDKEASALAVRMRNTGLTIEGANERAAAKINATAAADETKAARQASIADVKSEEQFARLASTIRAKFGPRKQEQAEAAVAKARADWNAAHKK